MSRKYGKGHKDRSELTEGEINLLLESTDFTREEIVKWHSEFLMDCPRGEMDRKILTNVYKRLYPCGKPDKFCSQVFSVFDLDGSGRIDFSEFLMAISVSTKGDVKQQLKLAFRMYDIDHNGTIDKKEMEKVILAIYDLLGEENQKGANSPTNRVAFVFDKLDTDRNGTLNEDEFVDGCLSDPILMAMISPYH